MRGNRYARNFDVTKTRKERKKKYNDAIQNTNRVKRLKSRLGKLKERRDKKSNTSHISALMESYVLRRKIERKKEKDALEGDVTIYTQDKKCGADNNGTSSRSTIANKAQKAPPPAPVSDFRRRNGYTSDEDDTSQSDGGSSYSDDSSIDLSALEGVVWKGGSKDSHSEGPKNRGKFVSSNAQRGSSKKLKGKM